jgi:hypothetical protein
MAWLAMHDRLGTRAVLRAVTTASAALLLLAACSDEQVDRGGPGTGGAAGAGAYGAGGSGAGNGGHGGSVPPVCPAPAPSVSGYYVAPSGTPQSDGSVGAPWDIATGVNQPPGVSPGDTVWLRGGTYAGAFVVKLDGTAEAPITVRSYPGEWAVLDGAGSTDPGVQIYHSYTVLRDLEIMSSSPNRTVDRPSGVYVEGPGHALVNVIVHDVGTGAICNSATAATPELAPELTIYGSFFYDNGWEAADRGHGHNLYLQNRDGTKHVRDNVLFYAFGFGLHGYSDTDDHFTQGYDIIGNVWFGNGAATMGAASKLYDGCLVGHNGTHPAARVTLRENMGWAPNSVERDVRLGWAAPNEDAHLFDNYLVGTTVFQPSWQSVEMTGNTFYGSVDGLGTGAYPDNGYVAARPTGAQIFVRPNEFEPGRAHVVVYNWDLADSVEVDLSAALQPGSRFELRHVHDLLGPPVLAGTYDGSPVSIPMTEVPPPDPIGYAGAIDPTETPRKELGVFLLLGCPST